MNIEIPAWVNGDLRPVEKLEVHRRGLVHKAISVFVFRGEDVLLQRRSLTKYHTPGLWANTCCSHPNWGESSRDCASRRLHEELGITGLELSFETSAEYRADVGDGLIEHEIVDIYFARAGLGLEIDPNPGEVMATRWINLRKLREDVIARPQDFTPWLRIYLERDLVQAHA